MPAAPKRKKKPGEIDELRDMEIDRVDAVTEPATQIKWLMLKSLEEGPSLAELLSKAETGGDGGGDSEREKLHQEQEARSRKYGIGIKEGGHLTPPKGYPTDPDQYGDPVNYRYPVDEEHIQPAVGYFNHEGQREAGGYTTEEWAIIGRRIAGAANKLLGDGYKFEGGKIVTPSTEKEASSVAEETQDQQQVAKQEGEAPELNGVPGSPEWEKEDAALLQQAVQGLLAVKALLAQALKREQVEETVGEGDWQDVSRLYEALDELAELIGQVGAAAAMEAAEAGQQVAVAASIEKIGKRISKENMDKIKAAMTHLANVAGCKTIKEFASLYETAPEEGEGEAGGEEKGKQAASKSEQQETSKSSDASGEHLEASVVIKALEATGLVDLAKSAGDLLKAVESVQRLEERVKALEEQPLPGGPMLRGRASNADYYLVRKGDGPTTGADSADLEKVLNSVQDPYLRDVLSREVARALHPAHAKE